MLGENKDMNKKTKAAKLVDYIKRLPDFVVLTNIDSNYHHMGATIADAVLQARMNYETHVLGRIKEIRKRFPNASTVSGLFRVLKHTTVKDFLNWRGIDRTTRFQKIADLFFAEGLETERDLKHWLEEGKNIPRLRSIYGVGPKTIDYFKIMTGIQTVAVDRRLRDFLQSADISFSGYVEPREIIVDAAELMNVQAACLDHSIWKYEGKNKKFNVCK